MLVEAKNTFKIGEIVIVSATKQIGTIIAFESGRWKVKLSNAKVLKESHEIEKRQMLFE